MLILQNCETDELIQSFTDKSQNKFIKINNYQIGIVNDMLKFDDFNQFHLVLKDYYQNPDIYKDYFEDNRPIINGELAFTDFILKLESKKIANEVDLNSLLKENQKNVNYLNNEITPIFRMDYKNMFCNLDGYIQIGEFIYKYDNSGRHKIPLSDYKNSNFFQNSSYEHLSQRTKKDSINNRVPDFAGSCTDQVKSKRINCATEVDMGIFFNANCVGTNVEVIAESKMLFQRKIIFWENRNADLLTILIQFQVRNSNNQIVMNIDDIRQTANYFKTSWGFVGSFCGDCTLLYDFDAFQTEFIGDDGGTDYNCNLSLETLGNEVSVCP